MEDMQSRTTGGAGTTGASPGADARAGLEAGKQQARELAGTAKQRAREEVEARREGAATQVDKLAGAVQRAREELGDESPMASYAGQLAGSMNQFAERLRNRNADELFNDFQQLARANPGLFLLGSVGIGFALSRFLKASPAGSSASTGGIEPLAGGDPRPLHESPAAYEPPLGTTAQPYENDVTIPPAGSGITGGAPGTATPTAAVGGTTTAGGAGMGGGAAGTGPEVH